MPNETPYEKALAAIDAAHALDPNKTTISGTEVPYELHYAQKCTSYLEKRAPNASPLLHLAIRAQHFRRWETPRSDYPATRIGYHSWRTNAKKRQAELIYNICIESGFSTEESENVGALIRKEGLNNTSGQDSEVQVLEDVACLVFLDDQFEGFKTEHDDGKIVGILRKTWGKMSPKGRELAGEMVEGMSERGRELLERALAEA